MNNKIKGKAGEDIVSKYIEKQGYEVIERNFRTSIGEIDIIAAHDGCIVFIEVKTRKNDEYGMPAEAVDTKKQQTISRVASQYLQKYNKFDYPVRFDVAEVWIEQSKITIIQNAFDSYIRY